MKELRICPQRETPYDYSPQCPACEADCADAWAVGAHLVSTHRWHWSHARGVAEEIALLAERGLVARKCCSLVLSEEP